MGLKMLKKVILLHTSNYTHLARSLSSLVHQPSINNENVIPCENIIPESDIYKESSILVESKEDSSNIAPYTKPSFNFAAYVNKSETLQELLKLGVNLYKLEKKTGVPKLILGLDFKEKIKPTVMFLHEFGLSIEEIGTFLSKNPFIFKEERENLEARINYLFSKKFTKEMVLRIINLNNYWLNFSIERMDQRLGFFQKQFSLTGSEVRTVAVKQPKLITNNIQQIKTNYFVVKEEMGFDDQQLKQILLKKPKLFMKNQNSLLKTFEYVHNTMNISHDIIVKLPQILSFRVNRLKERHMYLEKLGKAQFDPSKPNYVSLSLLAEGTDVEFCDKVAKTSVQSFNIFLKTL